MTVFILGPTYWRDDHAPRVPSWVADHLPNDWDRMGDERLEPVDVRAALCGFLRDAGVGATIMRMHPDRDEGSNIEKFHRIEEELNVERFLVYYPYGAKGEGHVGEMVALLDRHAHGHAVDLRVFPQTTVVDKTGGAFHVLEEGRGTAYLHDLITHGFPVPDWETYAGLFRAVRWHAEP